MLLGLYPRKIYSILKWEARQMNEIPKLAVLCVSDEPLLLDILSDALSSQRLEVITAQLADEAKLHIENNHERLIGIVVDENTDNKHIDGLELRRLTVHHRLIPYILITKPHESEVAITDLNLNISTVITKPINGDIFFTQIEETFAERREILLEKQIVTESYLLEGERALSCINIDIQDFVQNTNLRQSLRSIFKSLQLLTVISRALQNSRIHDFCDTFSQTLQSYILQETPINNTQCELLSTTYNHLESLWLVACGKKKSSEIAEIDLELSQSMTSPKLKVIDQIPHLNNQSNINQEESKIRQVEISANDIEQINEILGETVIQKNLLEKKLINLQRELPQHNGISESFIHLTEMNRYQGLLQEKISSMRTIKFLSLITPIIGECRILANYFQKSCHFEIIDNNISVFQKSAATIYDCIRSVVRNSIEHGIENKDKRLSVGKNQLGHIKIEITESANNYIITVSDDGKGIDFHQLKSRIIEQKLLDEDYLDTLDDSEIFEHIFSSSYKLQENSSQDTREEIGFAFLKKEMRKVHGDVNFSTEDGCGTSCIMSVPRGDLSTSEVVIVITVKEEFFGISQTKICRMISLNQNSSSDFYQEEGGIAYLFEGKIISLVSLSKILEGKNDVGITSSEDLSSYGDIIVVKNNDEQLMGILVDNVIESEEIVNRKLSQVANEKNLFYGAAILGDSKLGLIIDIEALMKILIGKSYFRPHNHDNSYQGIENFSTKDSPSQNSQVASIIIFRTPSDSLFGIDHKYIDRVEFFGTYQLKKIGNENMAIFRGNSINILDLDEYLNLSSQKTIETVSSSDVKTDDSEGIYSLITKSDHESLAFSVREIVDTIDVDKSEFLKSEIVQPQFNGHFIYKEELVSIVSPKAINVSTGESPKKSADSEKKPDSMVKPTPNLRLINSNDQQNQETNAKSAKETDLGEERDKAAESPAMTTIDKTHSAQHSVVPVKVSPKEAIENKDEAPMNTAAGWGIFD